MKKILSVLCVLAFIASFACIGTSAADVAATLSVVATNPVEGETTFTADVVATIPEGGDVTLLGVQIAIPEGLTLVSCEQAEGGFGSFVTSETIDTNPYVILWVSGTKSLPAGDNAIATMTFSIPADAAVDTSWEIGIAVDPDGIPASVAGDEYALEQIELVGATVVLEAAPVITTVTTEEPTEEPTEIPTEIPTETEEEPTEAEPTETEATETEATEATTTETETETETTKAPVSNNPQTGDMAFVVVAVMVVALGAAVVVKKVSAK